MQYKLTLFIELKQYFPPKLIPSEKAQKKLNSGDRVSE
jgi:hypothetical protein